ncbi:hypothetical protein NQ318_001214 [Aromia moschata]|uniref:Uncharacterized protein n=1 Tax=Aromia moschata TaxID=1265417 RepID=A0AAV8ZEW5_9CUCU|nr:hypothetical protein NQ318_001214 [Aromia moschata]
MNHVLSKRHSEPSKLQVFESDESSLDHRMHVLRSVGRTKPNQDESSRNNCKGINCLKKRRNFLMEQGYQVDQKARTVYLRVHFHIILRFYRNPGSSATMTC